MRTIAIANRPLYRGVTFNRLSKKWQAQILYGGRQYYLGVYETPDQAARVYDLKAKELCGEAAILNFPDGHLDDVEVIRRKFGPAHQFNAILTENFLRSEYLDKGRTVRQIGMDTGISHQTILNYIRHYSLPTRERGSWQRRYIEPSNVSGFFGPSSDWHAYWLGFIAADGYVGLPNMVRVKLKMDDANLLKNLQEGLNTDVPVKISTSRQTAEIEIHNRNFTDALRRWGIDSNKTFGLTFPNIPDDYVGAFIRGYFDGDGTVYRRSGRSEIVCRFISGSHQFIESLRFTLNRFGIATNKTHRSRNSNAIVLPLSSRKSNLRSFARFIYEGASVDLERKRQIFAELLSKER